MRYRSCPAAVLNTSSVAGSAGKILAIDPSGNFVELFQPAGA